MLARLLEKDQILFASIFSFTLVYSSNIYDDLNAERVYSVKASRIYLTVNQNAMNEKSLQCDKEILFVYLKKKKSFKSLEMHFTLIRAQ